RTRSLPKNRSFYSHLGRFSVSGTVFAIPKPNTCSPPGEVKCRTGNRGKTMQRRLMQRRLLRTALAWLVAIAGCAAPMVPAHAAPARIKDIVDVEGIRDNQLVGYGLV